MGTDVRVAGGQRESQCALMPIQSTDRVDILHFIVLLGQYFLLKAVLLLCYLPCNHGLYSKCLVRNCPTNYKALF